jgi:adenosine deaminase
MASIRQFCSNYSALSLSSKTPNLRIGHGVAFLYGVEDPTCSELSRDVANFRDFMKIKKIVCELSPTSNHMLLPDSFMGDDLGNSRTLRTFKKARLPVVLCTDDDGIWAIRKCVPHYRHISVVHEYCSAICNQEIECESDLHDIIDTAQKARFSGKRVT